MRSLLLIGYACFESSIILSLNLLMGLKITVVAIIIHYRNDNSIAVIILS